MNTDDSFRKALYLLDRDDVVRGEQLLYEVVKSTESTKESLYYAACCCLGELLIKLGRNTEAVPLLERVAVLEGEDSFDDVLSYEIRRSRELLACLKRA